MLAFHHIVFLDFIVAWTVFGASGVVLDIKNAGDGGRFFNCNFFSSFTSEDEKLFLANRNSFKFIDIHNIPLKIHYNDMVNLITITDRITNGSSHTGRMPKTKDVSTLKKLIQSEMKTEYTSSPYISIYKIPKYIAYCFHQLVKNKTHIRINTNVMNKHMWCYSKSRAKNVYGAASFPPLKLGYLIKCYGILPDTIITIEHVLSILLYTNSFTFSSTYRKLDLYESDAALKRRHSEKL